MIKLTDLIKELEEIEVRPAMAKMPDEDDEFLKKGFRTTPVEIDPETGAITSKVEYLSGFKKLKTSVYDIMDKITPYSYSEENKSIQTTAKEINSLLSKTIKLIDTLDNKVKLDKEMKK